MKQYQIENIHTEGWSLIHKAAYCDRDDILRQEMDNGISANHISNSFKSKYIPFIGKKNDVYFNNMYPLYLAAQRGNIRCVKLLLDRGADPKIKIYNKSRNVYSDSLEIAFIKNNFKCYYLIKNYNKNKQNIDILESPLLINVIN